MAKRKREPRIEFYSTFFKIGIREVDEIVAERFFEGMECRDRCFFKDENSTEDRISKLPDDILEFIISSLTMREGAATSILSRRWRNLWSRSAVNLEFDDSNLFGYEYPQDMFVENQKKLNKRKERLRNRKGFPQSRYYRRKGSLERERIKLVNRVSRILKFRRATRMDKFIFTFPMGKESFSHVDKWMKLAATQGVTKLELDFDWYFNYVQGKDFDRYRFPVQRFGSSLNYLCLNFCVFNFPPRFQGLNSLVILNLNDCSLTSNHVQNIVSNCPSLKWLSLRDCDFPPYTILKFVGPSIPLKHLDITRCYRIYEIGLNDVNLSSFELFGYTVKLLIKNAPRLSRLLIHEANQVEILGNVSHLRKLFLQREPQKLSAFNNIKHLVFSAVEDMSNLFEVVGLLETCPLLQRLVLDMGTFYGICTELTGQNRQVIAMPGCLHKSLIEVVIYAFENHPVQIEFAKYLLKNAIVLEKMRIYTTCKTFKDNGLWELSENGKLVGTALKEVYKLLKKEARPSTKLLIRPR